LPAICFAGRRLKELERTTLLELLGLHHGGVKQSLVRICALARNLPKSLNIGDARRVCCLNPSALGRPTVGSQ